MPYNFALYATSSNVITLALLIFYAAVNYSSQHDLVEPLKSIIVFQTVMWTIAAAVCSTTILLTREMLLPQVRIAQVTVWVLFMLPVLVIPTIPITSILGISLAEGSLDVQKLANLPAVLTIISFILPYLAGTASGLLAGIQFIPGALRQIGIDSKQLYLVTFIFGLNVRLSSGYIFSQIWALFDRFAPMYVGLWLTIYIAESYANYWRKNCLLWTLRVARYAIWIAAIVRLCTTLQSLLGWSLQEFVGAAIAILLIKFILFVNIPITAALTAKITCLAFMAFVVSQAAQEDIPPSDKKEQSARESSRAESPDKVVRLHLAASETMHGIARGGDIPIEILDDGGMPQDLTQYSAQDSYQSI